MFVHRQFVFRDGNGEYPFPLPLILIILRQHTGGVTNTTNATSAVSENVTGKLENTTSALENATAPLTNATQALQNISSISAPANTTAPLLLLMQLQLILPL